jgi:ubiquinone/menaquinone biosynthesis C-methylase UbiE
MSNGFDGPLGGLIGAIMARVNAQTEAEAVELLDPAPDASVLVLGFGPGVGVERLAKRLPRGHVVGVDPSATMLKAASRRNRAAIAVGRVRLERAAADATGAADASFDGAVAVNTLQLCEPFEATAAELARVMRPGARLVALTHDWAARRHGQSADAWVDRILRALEAAGFTDARAFRARAEKGRSIAVTARRA